MSKLELWLNHRSNVDLPWHFPTFTVPVEIPETLNKLKTEPGMANWIYLHKIKVLDIRHLTVYTGGIVTVTSPHHLSSLRWSQSDISWRRIRYPQLSESISKFHLQLFLSRERQLETIPWEILIQKLSPLRIRVSFWAEWNQMTPSCSACQPYPSTPSWLGPCGILVNDAVSHPDQASSHISAPWQRKHLVSCDPRFLI